MNLFDMKMGLTHTYATAISAVDVLTTEYPAFSSCPPESSDRIDKLLCRGGGISPLSTVLRRLASSAFVLSIREASNFTGTLSWDRI